MKIEDIAHENKIYCPSFYKAMGNGVWTRGYIGEYIYFRYFLYFCGTFKPKSVISVMMIIDYVFEQMFCHFEGAMGCHCNRKATRQMTKGCE